MTGPFPATHAILSAQALAERVLPEFGLGPIAQCRLHSPGINDTYRVQTVSGVTYYLRVYRARWRSPADIGYELDALLHLKGKGFPVAWPVRCRDGSLTVGIDAPEGRRYAALFVEAPGVEPDYEPDPAIMAARYGRAVAEMHNALDDFTSSHRRFHIDLEHLIDAPLRHVEPFLASHSAEWSWLQETATDVRARIQAVPEGALEQAFCHGDLQGYHARIGADGTLTHFDFDCCGYGFRAYDLAVFRWCALLSDKVAVWWEPYLNTYCETRPLADVDVQAVPLFVCARVIWHMGLHAENAPDWGAGDLNEAYYGRQLGRLRAAYGSVMGQT